MDTQTHDGIEYDIGWRYSETPKVVGAELRNSRRWIGDEPTGDELNGVCAFDAREHAEQYAGEWSHGYILKVGGAHVGYDADIEHGVIIADAIALGCEPWRLQNAGEEE